ncbi:MAG: rdgB [Micrococcaceae bacterium]|nr:rdgB [Micrococcaceae bacterium]
MTGAGVPPSDAAPGASPGAAVDRLVEVVALLRRHCPWTAALGHASLLEYLVEETYELYEAVDDVTRAERPSPELLDELRGELGDVLFQVVLHAQLQAEKEVFDLADVAAGLTEKLVRRNPHVFSPDGNLLPISSGSAASTDEIVETWHAVKRREKPLRSSPFDGIPRHLPALALAAKTLKRAGEGAADGAIENAGLTGPINNAGPMNNAGRIDDAGPAHHFRPADDEAALGESLLDLTRRAVHLGIDPERALRRAVTDYQDRAAGNT